MRNEHLISIQRLRNLIRDEAIAPWSRPSSGGLDSDVGGRA